MGMNDGTPHNSHTDDAATYVKAWGAVRETPESHPEYVTRLRVFRDAATAAAKTALTKSDEQYYRNKADDLTQEIMRRAGEKLGSTPAETP